MQQDEIIISSPVAWRQPEVPEVKAVPAVAKCLAIVRFLDAHMATGASLATLASSLDITKSHCLQILRTLVAEGWVFHDEDRQRYALSPSLLVDVAALLGGHDRGQRTHDILMRLSTEVRLPCVLSRINPDYSFTAIDKAEEGAELLVSVRIGHQFERSAPAQMRARIAACPPERWDELITAFPVTAFNRRTLTAPAAIRAEVAAARDQGYAVGRMEYQEGVMTLATAIVDRFGEPRMTLQCPGLAAAVASREQQIGTALRAAALSIQNLHLG